MTNKPNSGIVPVCPNCGAAAPPTGTRCWLCAQKLAETEKCAKAGALSPYASPAEVPVDDLYHFSLATLMLLVTVFCIVVGVCSISLGIGIPLALLVVIPFARTAMLVRARAKRGRETSWSERLALAAISALVSVLLTVLVAVGSVVAFFLLCWIGSFAGGVSGREELTIAMSLGGLLIGVLGCVAFAVYLAVLRFRHDVHR